MPNSAPDRKGPGIGYIEAMRRVLVLALLAIGPSAALLATGGTMTPSPTPCMVSGSIVADVSLHELQHGGAALGTLTGTSRWLRVSDFGATGATRVRVRSSKSTPNLRFEAWADPAELPITVAQNLEVSPKLVSIRATVPLRVIEQGVVRVQPRKPTFDSIEAQVACSELRMELEKPAAALPKGATSMLLTSKKFDLFPSSKGGAAFTLSVAAGRTPRLSAYESANGRTHVRFADDVVLDGWVPSNLLDPTTTGEGGLLHGIGGLGAWGTSASPWYAQRDADVRFTPSMTALVVAVLEKGAKVALWSSANPPNGWQQVRVYDADYNAPTGKELWVKMADLGPNQP